MIGLYDALQVAGYVALTTLLMASVGVALLLAVRRRSLLLSVIVVAGTAVLAVVVGAVVAASAMFLSPHDLQVLLFVVALAGIVGLILAVVLGRQVVRGSRALGAAAARLGDGAYRSPTVPLSAELMALDAQLAEMSSRLEQGRARERELEASRRELVAWISHDLRTPLAGIRAMSEALEDGVVEDDVTIARYQSGIRREADRLSDMVDDLFELSRINANALRLDLQDLALHDVVSDAVATASAVAATRGVSVQARAVPSLQPVRGSVRELSRALGNLLANAVTYTPSGGSVRVEAFDNGDTVVIEVYDSCGGIAADDLPRLFEVAFRGTTARTPGGDAGAGLGLAITRGLIEAHGGTITVTNVEGGCCARLQLPAAEQVPTRPDADAGQGISAPGVSAPGQPAPRR